MTLQFHNGGDVGGCGGTYAQSVSCLRMAGFLARGTIALAPASLCLLAFRAENLGIGTTNVISFQLLGRDRLALEDFAPAESGHGAG